MNWNLLSSVFLILLLFGPGALLLIRFLKGQRFPWWIVIVLSLIVVWGCALGASISSTEHLAAQMRDFEVRGEPVPDELMEDWASDAHAVFALMFGWAFAVPVLGGWLAAYAMAHGIRRSMIRRRGTAREQ